MIPSHVSVTARTSGQRHDQAQFSDHSESGGRGPAAEDLQIERIFVNAAMWKGAMPGRRLKSCMGLQGAAMVDHTYQFHGRVRCRADNDDCHGELEVSGGEGCGKELDWWFTDAVLHPKP
jgi:penicillin-insensitive murein DD-endopeptidase